MREWYQGKTLEQRRALVSMRDAERVRAADRVRSKTPGRRAHTARNSKRWREQNPEKYAAHLAVGKAIRDGRLKREPCEVCGAKRVHAHHDDYSKPLIVRWRCALHHAELRRR